MQGLGGILNVQKLTQRRLGWGGGSFTEHPPPSADYTSPSVLKGSRDLRSYLGQREREMEFAVEDSRRTKAHYSGSSTLGSPPPQPCVRMLILV